MKRCILLAAVWLVGTLASPSVAAIYTLVPNEDLSPLEWYVYPGGSPNHWSLIDEGDPYDNQFVHGNVHGLRDRYGFPNPSGQGNEFITEVRVHIKAEVELRGAVSEVLSFKYFMGGVERGSIEFTANSDGIYNWSEEFPESGPLNAAYDFEVEIETMREYPASIAVHFITVQIVTRVGSKEPDPQEE